MKEDTVLDLTPLCVDLDTTNLHCFECVRLGAAFISEPTFENKAVLAIREVRYIVLKFVRDRSSLANLAALVEQSTAQVLDLIAVAVHIVPVKVTDLVSFPVVDKVQVVKFSAAFVCIPIVRIIPVLPSLDFEIKAGIFRVILASNFLVTRADH